MNIYPCCRALASNGFAHTVLALLVVVVATSRVQALGLGDIKTGSFLGQPLQASIGLVGADQYAPDEIRVRQLNNRQAAELGIDLVGSQPAYQIEPALNGGQLTIALSSREPIVEPFLNVVIELSWPTGKVYREYTVLIDPIANAIDVASTSTAEPVTTVSTPVRRAEPALKLGSGRYRVRPGDSLSKIADQLSQGSNSSRDDMMRWLLVNNPRAFIQGDRNRLLAGALLTLPANSDIVAAATVVTPSAKPITPSAKPITPGQATITEPVAEPPPTTAVVEPPTDQRLSVTIADISEAEVYGNEQVETNDADRLRAQLVVINEVVDRLQRENLSMRRRLQDIEQSSQLASLERLLLLKDEEITALQMQMERRDRNPAQTPLSTNRAADQNVSNNIANSNNAANEPEVVSTGSVDYSLWLIAFLCSALVGAGIFFYRWRSQDSVTQFRRPSNNTVDTVWSQQLDDIVYSPVEFDRPVVKKNGATLSVVGDTEAVADTALSYERQPAYQATYQVKPANNNGKWRLPDDVVKKRIAEKTRGYIPPELEEHDKYHHDALDDLISNAIDAANRGEFEVADAMLRAERVQQACLRSADSASADSRLESALQFIEQLQRGEQAG